MTNLVSTVGVPSFGMRTLLRITGVLEKVRLMRPVFIFTLVNDNHVNVTTFPSINWGFETYGSCAPVISGDLTKSIKHKSQSE